MLNDPILTFWASIGYGSPNGIRVYTDLILFPACQNLKDKGKFAQNKTHFTQRLKNHSISNDEFTLTEGFFSDTLTPELQNKLPIQKAAVIYLNSDLYLSTKEALHFIEPYLQTGTVIAVDRGGYLTGSYKQISINASLLPCRL